MMMLMALVLAAAAAAPANGGDEIVVQAQRFPGTRIPDEELARLRGGIRLPNGLDINIAVHSQTSLNGALLLRSVYRIDEGAPTLTLFAPAEGQTVATPAVQTGSSGSPTMAVIFNRTTGTLLVPGWNAGGTPVSVNSGGAMGEMAAGGGDLQPVAIVPGGTAATAGGVLSLSDAGRGLRATLDGDDIGVAHFFGQGYGTLVTNSGNDRTIDTVTSISLDLQGATPQNLGSALLRVDAMAIDAARGMIR